MFSTVQFVALFLLCLPWNALSTRVVLTNDDGWAVAQIRSEYDALKAAGYQVVLSAPAQNKSGTGSSSANPTTLTQPCEFNSCPTGSPGTGHDASDANLNYVNAYPVDSARYGIQIAPTLIGGVPDIVFSGTNIGNNLGSTVLISGTVGAASEAAKEGYPSIAFSGASGSQVSYTTLQTDPNSAASKAAKVYTDLSLKFLSTILAGAKANNAPTMPKGISVNVNYAATSTSTCPSASAFKWVFTRINASSSASDVSVCGTTTLPDESSAIKKGCIATVSVFDGTTKGDVNAATQGAVLKNIQSILGCL